MHNGRAVSSVPRTRMNGHASASRWVLAATTHGLEIAVDLHVDPFPEPNGDDRDRWDIVQEWGEQSFPASDPPANW